MAILLHLSDIHFRRHSGNPFDVDADLRNEIVLDAERVASDIGAPDAILIGGDIAYSGHRQEYETAKEWLEEVATKVSSTLANIWCVPGNHDVDQSVIKNSPILTDLQNAIRGAGPKGIDQKLLGYLGDPAGKAQLYSSIAEFNAFAEPFGFNLSAEKPTTETDLVLGDRSILRVHGLNSTVVSNHLDNKIRNVVLGRYQLPKRVPGVTNIVLCHHPPDWWSDDDSLKDDIAERAHIQLYGHKHRQVMHRFNNSLQIVAGAVHPERQEDHWRPRYNWVVVEVVMHGGSRHLNVKVYPRVLSENETRFIADTNSCGGSNFKAYRLDLEPWEDAAPPVISSGASTTVPGTALPAAEVHNAMTNPIRVLTYRLFELPYLTRLSIAQELKLMRNEDGGLRDYDVFRRVLERANAENKLADLWDKVQSAHKDGNFSDNPFQQLHGGDA